jgi:FkbM family methyltransferase
MTHPNSLESWSARWFLRPGNVVFDIGTFHGTNAARYLGGQASAVYGFEPLARNRDLIPRTVTEHPSFHLLPYALSDRSGRQTMMVPRRNSGAASLSRSFFENIKHDDSDPGEAEEVEVRTLDSLGLPRANFWKIDVEGAELSVLKGAEQTVRHSPPDIVQLEIFAIDPDIYSATLKFLIKHFTHVWAIGVTEERRPVHYPVTPENVAKPLFHSDLSRGGTPHYYASSRRFWDWAGPARTVGIHMSGQTRVS